MVGWTRRIHTDGKETQKKDGREKSEDKNLAQRKWDARRRQRCQGGGGVMMEEGKEEEGEEKEEKEEEKEEEEEEEGLFKADAVNEEDPERDRATQV